jgi:hypothetical protein
MEWKLPPKPSTHSFAICCDLEPGFSSRSSARCKPLSIILVTIRQKADVPGRQRTAFAECASSKQIRSTFPSRSATYPPSDSRVSGVPRLAIAARTNSGTPIDLATAGKLGYGISSPAVAVIRLSHFRNSAPPHRIFLCNILPFHRPIKDIVDITPQAQN